MVVSSDDEGPETTAQIVHRLDEIDAFLRNEQTFGDDVATLMSYLKSDEDIGCVLRQNDTELHELAELFIQEHIDQADEICSVYHNFSKSEEQLVDFETAIVTFQQRLEKTSDDIVVMQHQTDQLVHSITNRRRVSEKIKEIYTALRNCDSLCEEIVKKEVDQNYLTNLRELENSLTFLSRKELKESAVDKEIRPKLVAAALKAGNKLKRFLSKQITALVSNPDTLESNQQILEQNGHFAYHFLRSYNPPVAGEIVKLYVSSMSSMYRKQLEPLLRSFAEASELHAFPLDPVVLSKEVTTILSNHDAGSPAENQVEAPAWNGFPARTLTPKERSVSRHLLSLTNIFNKSDVPCTLRKATFQDTTAVVRSLEIRHGRLQSCPTSAAELDRYDCWVWQLVKCLQALVNVCMTECRFIGAFFAFSDESSVEGNINGAERLSRAVLDPTICVVESSIKEYAPLVLDRVDVLAALRCIDIIKQYLCTLQDPIPLLMLSGMLEISKSIFKGNLRIALHNDRVALGYLSSMKLRTFQRAPTLNAKTLAKLLYEQDYAVTLGPQSMLLRVGELLGQLDLLNTAPFFRFCFKENGVWRTYDTHVSAFIATSLNNLLDFVEQLAKRHPSPLSRSFFICSNIFFINDVWRTLATQFAQKELGNTPFDSSGFLHWGSMDTAHFLSICSNSDTLVASGEAYQSFSGSKNAKILESQLEKALEALVATYGENQSSFDYFFSFEKDMVQELGEDFFSPAKEPPAAVPEVKLAEKSASPKLSAAKTLNVATTFYDHWRDQVSGVVADITQAAHAILEGFSPTTHPRANTQHLCSEFVHSILGAYCQALVRANDRLSILARKVHAKKTNIQSKLVSSSVFISEMNKIIRCDIK